MYRTRCKMSNTLSGSPTTTSGYNKQTSETKFTGQGKKGTLTNQEMKLLTSWIGKKKKKKVPLSSFCKGTQKKRQREGRQGTRQTRQATQDSRDHMRGSARFFFPIFSFPAFDAKMDKKNHSRNKTSGERRSWGSRPIANYLD